LLQASSTAFACSFHLEFAPQTAHKSEPSTQKHHNNSQQLKEKQLVSLLVSLLKHSKACSQNSFINEDRFKRFLISSPRDLVDCRNRLEQLGWRGAPHLPFHQ
jgi:hypothetical protein